MEEKVQSKIEQLEVRLELYNKDLYSMKNAFEKTLEVRDTTVAQLEILKTLLTQEGKA